MGDMGKVLRTLNGLVERMPTGDSGMSDAETSGFLLQSYLSMTVAVAKEERWKTERSSQQSNLDRCDVHCTAARLVLPVHQMPLIKDTFFPAFVAPSQYILYKVLPFEVYKNIPLIDVSKGVKESSKFLWLCEGGSNTETENKR